MSKAEILAVLERNWNSIVTGGELSRQLGVSRTAVWKAVNALRRDGHEIESLPNSGYRLLPYSDGLSESGIRSFLETSSIGKTLEILKSVPSTNDYLKDTDKTRLSGGYVVIADEQTGGRGRMNRSFQSPAREGIYLSVFLRPTVSIQDTQFLTLCAAVAVCRALESACGISAGIKWVNDIYCGGKKICGILTEAFVTAETQSVDYVVIGIGINTGRIGDDLRDIATSVFAITGARGVRNRLAAHLLNHFELVYASLVGQGNKAGILAEYRDRLFILGMAVEVRGPGRTYDAVVRDLDESGMLIVEDESGTARRIGSGEIHMKNNSQEET